MVQAWYTCSGNNYCDMIVLKDIQILIENHFKE